MKLNQPLELNISADFQTKGVKDSEDAPLIIRGMANTTNKDRMGDVIPQSAWYGPRAMPNYEKNPIILAFHDHSKPIGKMVDYSISEFGLEIEAEISKAAGPIYDLIKDGVLRTFSIGFRVLDADWDPDTDIFIIKELELLETSVVSVPCNQDSVFEVSKSLNADDYSNLKKQFNTSETYQEEETDELDTLLKYLGIRKEI